MRRIGIVAALITTLLLGGVALPATIPSAQAQEEEEWSCFFDFTLDDFSELFSTPVEAGIPGAVYADGIGWTDEGTASSGYHYIKLQTEVVSDGDTHFTHILFDVSYTGSLDPTFGWRIYGQSDPYDWVGFSGSPTGIGEWTGDRNLFDLGGEVGTGVIGFEGNIQQFTAGSFLIQSLLVEGYGPNTLCGDLFWQKPLTEADLVLSFQDGIIDTSDVDPILPDAVSPNPYASIAISDEPGQDVYSVVQGVVEYIYDPGDFNCIQAGLSDFFGGARPSECLMVFDPEPSIPASGVHAYRIDISNAYLVEVLLGDGKYLQYLVEDAPQYLTVGQTLQAGCILGQTLSLHAYDLSLDLGIFIAVSSPDDNRGLVLMELFEDVEQSQADTIPLQDRLIEPTDPGKACNANPEFSECLGSNPRFLNSGDTWNVRGGVPVVFTPGGGVDLNPGAEIFTLLPLDPDTEYTLTAGGITVETVFPGFPNTLMLRIGTYQETFDIDLTTSRAAIEGEEPGGTDSAGYYEVGMKNLGNVVIHVDFLCIVDGDAPLIPNSCYFVNHAFDLDSVGWTAGAGVEFPGDGTAKAPEADGALSQLVSLPPGDYTLRARVRPYYTVPADQVETSAGDIDVEYTFDGGTSTIGSLVWSGYVVPFTVLETTFTLAVDTTDTMSFDFTMNSAPEEFLGLQFDYFCLERDGGYPGGGVIPPFTPSCSVVPDPITTDVPSWLAWLWAQLDRFFQCDLMPLLNDMYVQMVNGINTMLRFSRYMIIVAQRQAAWLGTDAIPWLNGHLNNIAQGRTTTIIQDVGSGECHDIFCLLETLIERIFAPLIDAVTELLDVLLDVFVRVVGLLLDIVTGVIALIFSLFGAIIQFIVRMIDYLGAIITGFNSTPPIPLPGIPQCQLDPQGNAVCIGLWMLENTVFADEGVLYIPLLIGAMSIALLFWLVDTFRKEVSNLGDKL